MDAVGEAEVDDLGVSTPGVVDTAAPVVLAGLVGLVGARALVVLLSAHAVAIPMAATAMTAKHFIGDSLFRRPTVVRHCRLLRTNSPPLTAAGGEGVGR